ncbi:MOSC domain-containing protein [Ruegeria sp. WL0004]|uniref:MOSC domain-containing protein n=1 Tax=Ruegeria marisflavi TaxID=2984152 RepID=A0ABT2WLE8_9RHOB|nr:MOSC domain-containing protein [Ruegeria sp. WL0004]MCU9836719.1 MOSC domain-containing protein [Ruegeria sp. WL0004]
MTDLKSLIAGWAQPGWVAWIGLRPERRAALVAVDKAQVEVGGLAGDHGRPGKRAVTLVQGEHLSAIGSYLGRGAVSPFDLRRNIVVEGINLAALKDRPLRLGGAVLRLTVVCAPCSRMEETFGPGGYSAVRGHGGWCAEVLEPGLIGLGDAVRPAD